MTSQHQLGRRSERPFRLGAENWGFAAEEQTNFQGTIRAIFPVPLFLRFRNKRNEAVKCFLCSSFELCGRQTLPADPAGRSFGLLSFNI